MTATHIGTLNSRLRYKVTFFCIAVDLHYYNETYISSLTVSGFLNISLEI